MRSVGFIKGRFYARPSMPVAGAVFAAVSTATHSPDSNRSPTTTSRDDETESVFSTTDTAFFTAMELSTTDDLNERLPSVLSHHGGAKSNDSAMDTAFCASVGPSGPVTLDQFRPTSSSESFWRDEAQSIPSAISVAIPLIQQEARTPITRSGSGISAQSQSLSSTFVPMDEPLAAVSPPERNISMDVQDGIASFFQSASGITIRNLNITVNIFSQDQPIG
ncbi:hypothetical protein EST38_g8600 [Candolleomyces aberdarensis]|uniref:Uncharacterized protein n=1 Tax=Candolleomyces aberdarensis TaxID=2316362 RepID=A0A4Q2DC94_9AGAR|nr:hypothetical protein EST38_g8600 [Candolleomyces aberdarensis]